MPEFVQVGEFCPNSACDDYGKLQVSNIIKFGKTRAGHQRYRCQSCRRTFTETKDTIFYRKRTPQEEIIEALAFIAEGSRVSSVARAKGHKEDTILSWLREAAHHAEAVEEVLLKEHKVERGQLDSLWAYVGNKGEKKATQRQLKAASSGGPP